MGYCKIFVGGMSVDSDSARPTRESARRERFRDICLTEGFSLIYFLNSPPFSWANLAESRVAHSRVSGARNLRRERLVVAGTVH